MTQHSPVNIDECAEDILSLLRQRMTTPPEDLTAAEMVAGLLRSGLLYHPKVTPPWLVTELFDDRGEARTQGRVTYQIDDYISFDWRVSVRTDYCCCPYCGHQRDTSMRTLSFFSELSDAEAYAESLAGPNDTIDNRGDSGTPANTQGRKR